MLPAAHRLRRRDEFSAAFRGARAGTRRLVVHFSPAGEPVDGADASTAPAHPLRVGFVVSKAVGGSVVRHRVQRRLRHLAAAALPGLPAGGLLVVRALPAAADATSAELGSDLDRGLRRLGLGTPRPEAQRPGTS
ncbi:ribonuclease P protein component [Kineococcus sp. SYSU DK004]|uniref:ribonuclease P protein component n=1 Tax=Kineococcus sp. SYSU DK004 TaxID=3383125 RepID=UPI003D7CBBAA